MQQISRFPTRYEPLTRTFGAEASKNTFIRQEQDLTEIARLVKQAKTSGQSKLMFVYAPSESGAGKTTFIQSLDLFLPEIVATVHRIGGEQALDLEGLNDQIRKIPTTTTVTIVNIDGHESFAKNDNEYRNFGVQLNNCLRNRDDLVILWPVNNKAFAERVTEHLRVAAGSSIFGVHPIYHLVGLDKAAWPQVLDGILKIANWQLEDAALDLPTVEKLTDGSRNIGEYLDRIQAAIANNFDLSKVGFIPPQIVFAISSGKWEIRDVCRGLRRANSYYAEASRLQMYTTKSNAADWWNERNKSLKTCLPHVIALFNVQIVSLSASSVVHAVNNFADDSLKSLASSVTRNIGNAKTVMRSTELYKYSLGQDIDAREYGAATQDATFAAYEAIQQQSELKHKEINGSIMELAATAGGGFGTYELEVPQKATGGLIVDCIASQSNTDRDVFLEFHHKSKDESTYNKVSIYILTKLKEYAINFGISPP